MAKIDPEMAALNEQLADALAQIESLQTAVADAEARAATHSDRIVALEGEMEESRSENERLSSRLRDSAVKYREARLAASPHIPPDLVVAEEIDGIDEQMAAAEQVVSMTRERLEKERRESPPIPAGSPLRRGPGTSRPPPGGEVKLGLPPPAERPGPVGRQEARPPAVRSRAERGRLLKNAPFALRQAQGERFRAAVYLRSW